MPLLQDIPVFDRARARIAVLDGIEDNEYELRALPRSSATRFIAAANDDDEAGRTPAEHRAIVSKIMASAPRTDSDIPTYIAWPTRKRLLKAGRLQDLARLEAWLALHGLPDMAANDNGAAFEEDDSGQRLALGYDRRSDTIRPSIERLWECAHEERKPTIWPAGREIAAPPTPDWSEREPFQPFSWTGARPSFAPSTAIIRVGVVSTRRGKGDWTKPEPFEVLNFNSDRVGIAYLGTLAFLRGALHWCGTRDRHQTQPRHPGTEPGKPRGESTPTGRMHHRIVEYLRMPGVAQTERNGPIVSPAGQGRAAIPVGLGCMGGTVGQPGEMRLPPAKVDEFEHTRPILAAEVRAAVGERFASVLDLACSPLTSDGIGADLGLAPRAATAEVDRALARLGKVLERFCG